MRNLGTEQQLLRKEVNYWEAKAIHHRDHAETLERKLLHWRIAACTVALLWGITSWLT